ncbi:LamB/YcsF family protein [Allofrancisella guangzhouensis]|uniref:Lactam utilization protein LamB n=1 Tax=Allofrancisella guangzhouensis TaxID=594679 RepID=A0A0A8E2Y8_9GAMM|nr:5-oxoprolinase subunit PxpA [Allofrancisella guangzhouensis]AJC48329.1 lactam utilization protein LamB [Allofrancisella guangzhouensis]MBK2026582.1 LamB/YcsF family protein [Allofrancisella guangzhouensis]MBK2044326.1 LamB/YcsF family protein [Allofrancisella guangzhouensis]MBK2045569.1 LamB/YcsF family protein [Allofrancisella guangzhouensis]
MFSVNCDLGERGVAHPTDDELVNYIDIANIACSGHAGDKQSVEYYTKLCNENNVKITAHISYPDKKNFGRKIISIDNTTLQKSFDQQLALFDGTIKAIKPHGALYNQLNVDDKLANFFVTWCLDNSIKELLVSPFGILRKYAEQNDIKILKESFAERGYMLDKNNNPMLIPRGTPNAEIHDLSKALSQYMDLKEGFIRIAGKKVTFNSETICVHSDSKIALALVKEIYNRKG